MSDKKPNTTPNERPDPQWIDKRRVHNMLEHEHDSVPSSTPIHHTGWQAGLPLTERRYIDGFRDGIEHVDKLLRGWGWASTSGVAGMGGYEDDEDGDDD